MYISLVQLSYIYLSPSCLLHKSKKPPAYNLNLKQDKTLVHHKSHTYNITYLDKLLVTSPFVCPVFEYKSLQDLGDERLDLGEDEFDLG